jgi:hypothetical protein
MARAWCCERRPCKGVRGAPFSRKTRACAATISPFRFRSRRRSAETGQVTNLVPAPRAASVSSSLHVTDRRIMRTVQWLRQVSGKRVVVGTKMCPMTATQTRRRATSVLSVSPCSSCFCCSNACTTTHRSTTSPMCTMRMAERVLIGVKMQMLMSRRHRALRLWKNCTTRELGLQWTRTRQLPTHRSTHR